MASQTIALKAVSPKTLTNIVKYHEPVPTDFKSVMQREPELFQRFTNLFNMNEGAFILPQCIGVVDAVRSTKEIPKPRALADRIVKEPFQHVRGDTAQRKYIKDVFAKRLKTCNALDYNINIASIDGFSSRKHVLSAYMYDLVPVNSAFYFVYLKYFGHQDNAFKPMSQLMEWRGTFQITLQGLTENGKRFPDLLVHMELMCKWVNCFNTDFHHSDCFVGVIRCPNRSELDLIMPPIIYDVVPEGEDYDKWHKCNKCDLFKIGHIVGIDYMTPQMSRLLDDFLKSLKRTNIRDLNIAY
ncbi:hypothetical protein BgiBS90_028897 [Biomphalaria glabrata]|nr:hypothetical protein BgiBS90_028897 [Biomphalaria glabrata]